MKEEGIYFKVRRITLIALQSFDTALLQSYYSLDVNDSPR